jgi:hypothetical protein
MAEKKLEPEPGRFNWEEGDTVEFVAATKPTHSKTTKTSETTETRRGPPKDE